MEEVAPGEWGFGFVGGRSREVCVWEAVSRWPSRRGRVLENTGHLDQGTEVRPWMDRTGVHS